MHKDGALIVHKELFVTLAVGHELHVLSGHDGAVIALQASPHPTYADFGSAGSHGHGMSLLFTFRL